MSEEAVAELEKPELEETPSLEADKPTEDNPEQVATTEVDKDEPDEAEKKRINQENASRRKINKQSKDLRDSKQRIAELESQTQQTAKPKADNYENYDDFIEASIKHGIESGKETPQYNPVDDIANDLSAVGTQKYDDFEKVAWASKEMLPVLSEFDHPEDIAMYLGQNPKDAQRIQQMSDIGMAKEFALIEARVNTPKPRLNNAPEPTKPISDGETQPTDISKLSDEQAIARRNKERAGSGRPY